MITKLSIHGLRGFGEKKEMDFAIPNGTIGSGITYFVGQNNSGKTTILEAIEAFNCNYGNSPSFSEKKRNVKFDNGRIELTVVQNGTCFKICTPSSGGSETFLYENDERVIQRQNDYKPVYCLASRRNFEQEFNKGLTSRDDYLYNRVFKSVTRLGRLSDFQLRLFEMFEKKEEFDSVLKKALGDDLNWTIDQTENGNYYLKLIFNGCTHSSEGMGDGIWSIFTICDALYDSKEGDTIAIDEPELSLHPSLQKRVINLLKEYSKDRQIIIFTHSSYFIEWDSILNGAKLYRTLKNENDDIDLYGLTDRSVEIIRKLVKDLQKPHILGLEAKEIFFIPDQIILVEGQDDVVMYSKAAEQVGKSFAGTFFGWGAGGAGNIELLITILNDLGYKKIFSIFDGNKKEDKEKLEEFYTEYEFCVISKADVRDKKENKRVVVEGLLTEGGELKEDCKEEIIKLIDMANRYFD